jgi:hypothetical protein
MNIYVDLILCTVIIGLFIGGCICFLARFAVRKTWITYIIGSLLFLSSGLIFYLIPDILEQLPQYRNEEIIVGTKIPEFKHIRFSKPVTIKKTTTGRKGCKHRLVEYEILIPEL